MKMENRSTVFNVFAVAMSAANDAFCKNAYNFRWREPIAMASHLSAFLRCRQLQRRRRRRRRRKLFMKKKIMTMKNGLIG